MGWRDKFSGGSDPSPGVRGMFAPRNPAAPVSFEALLMTLNKEVKIPGTNIGFTLPREKALDFGVRVGAISDAARAADPGGGTSSLFGNGQWLGGASEGGDAVRRTFGGGNAGAPTSTAGAFGGPVAAGAAGAAQLPPDSPYRGLVGQQMMRNGFTIPAPLAPPEVRSAVAPPAASTGAAAAAATSAPDPAAATTVAAALDAAAAKVADLERQFLTQLQRVGTLDEARQVPALADATDRMAATLGTDSAEMLLTTHLAGSPVEHSIPALRGAVDDSIAAAAKRVATAAAARRAPGAERVVEKVAPKVAARVAPKVAARVASELATPAAASTAARAATKLVPPIAGITEVLRMLPRF